MKKRSASAHNICAVAVGHFSEHGYDASSLSDIAALAGMRIVMLTAKGRDTDVAKGLALGADAYLTKPFSTQELVRRVRELLGAQA